MSRKSQRRARKRLARWELAKWRAGRRWGYSAMSPADALQWMGAHGVTMTPAAESVQFSYDTAQLTSQALLRVSRRFLADE